MKSIPALFAEVVAQHAQRVAISTPEANWTYAELDQRSDAIAVQMLGQLNRTTEVVALLLPHGPSLISAILGVLKAGRLYLALDATEPLPRLAARLEDSDAKLLVADSSNLPLARQLESSQVIALELSDEPVLPSARVSFPEVSPSAGAWLVYTSGSTAEPKGVWQNHYGVVHHASVYRELIAVTPHDRLTLLTSLSLAASATHLFAALLSGATLCPFPLRAAGPGRLAKWLGDQHITVFHSVPTVYRRLLRSTPACMSSPHLRLIRLGGEPILAADVDQFRRHTHARLADSCVLMHALSSTETGLICAQVIDRNTALPPGRVSVGCPVRDAEVFLADEHGQPVGENREGRIAVRSKFLAQGYWRRAEATAASFRLDPRNRDRRVFVTGDLGRIRSDRSLEHLGRVDQQVKISGCRVDLAEGRYR